MIVVDVRHIDEIDLGQFVDFFAGVVPEVCLASAVDEHVVFLFDPGPIRFCGCEQEAIAVAGVEHADLHASDVPLLWRSTEANGWRTWGMHLSG